MRTHFLIVVILAQALATLAGCSSSSTSVTTPSAAQRCAVTISGPTSVGAVGGSASLTVSTDRDCQWTAQAEAQWLSLSPTSGQGAGTVGFAASPNQSTAARTTAIVVNGQRMEITQAAGSCQVAVSPTAFSLPAQGGEVKASLTIANFCGWNVVSRAPGWISASAGNGSGPAEVSLTIAPNTGPPRSGIVDIAGIEVNVSQASQTAGCSFSVDPTTITVGAQSTQAAVTVTADTGCAWFAASTVPWISISSGGSGSGSGSVVVEIAANQGGARTGQLLIGGQQVRIDQSGPGPTSCSYSITPTSATIGAAGGQLSTQVTTAAGCAWSTTGLPDWITVNNGSGSGSGAATVVVGTNAGLSRNATIQIAGLPFTVTQAASTPGCSYSIDPTSHSTTALGGQVTVTVSTAAGCAWSTTGLPDWITVTNGSGSGSGAATVVVGTNAGSSRNATIQIAGRPFTVTQAAAACTYTVTPTMIDADGSAQTKTVTVATGVQCSWTATVTTTEDWLRIKSGSSGTGAGTVTIEIDATANQGNKPRTATLLVAGQTVTVNQAASLPACSYNIDPTSYDTTALGGQVTVTVSTAAGCAWSTTGLPDWITVTNGSGSGSGAATVVVGTNAGPSRNATIQIAGRPFTVTQAASPPACSYNIDPTSYNTTALGGQVTVTVSTAAGCAWSTTGLPDWITVTNGSGSGSGAATVVVGTNAGSSRNATIQIAGRPFTVTQAAAACTYTVTPTTIDADGSAQTKTVTVNTGVHCSWTAAVTTTEDWLRIKSGSSGTGTGTVTIEIDAKSNPGNKSRTATLLVAGQTVTVNQQ